MRRLLLCMLLGLIIKDSTGQPPKTSNWFNLQLPVVFNNHWQWWNEASYRTYGETFRVNQSFIRTGARYSFNQNVSVALTGDLFFSKVKANKDDHEFGKEKRLWQELNFQFPLKDNFFLQNRIRIEERFVGETSRAEAYNTVRFRYRLAAMKRFSEKWGLQLSEELLEQLDHNEIDFNLSRASLAAVCQFSSTAQLQGAYYWSQSKTFSQHIFSIVFQKKIVVHHKKKTSA